MVSKINALNYGVSGFETNLFEFVQRNLKCPQIIKRFYILHPGVSIIL